MSSQQQLIASLNALEASIPRHSMGTSAIVQGNQENLSEGLVGIFKTMSELGSKIDVVECKTLYPVLRGSNIRVEVSSFTSEAYVITRAGKLKLPGSVRVKRF